MSVIRTPGPDQEVRRHHRRRRHRPRRPRGRRLRLPRRQRLGQDHDGADAARAGAGHVRHGRGPRPDDAERGVRGAAAGRGTGRVAGGLPAAVGPRQPAGARRARRRAARGRAGRVDDVLDRVGLGGVDERPVAAYSLGMRQRLGLAHALLPTTAGRGCWCSTSPPTASTRRASARSGGCCSTSTRPAPPSSCPATCSPRSSRWPRGSGSSTAVASWSRSSSTCSSARPAAPTSGPRTWRVRAPCSTGRSSRSTSRRCSCGCPTSRPSTPRSSTAGCGSASWPPSSTPSRTSSWRPPPRRATGSTGHRAGGAGVTRSCGSSCTSWCAAGGPG